MGPSGGQGYVTASDSKTTQVKMPRVDRPSLPQGEKLAWTASRSRTLCPCSSVEEHWSTKPGLREFESLRGRQFVEGTSVVKYAGTTVWS